MATEEKVIISCEKQKESLYYEIQGLDEEKRKLLWEILMKLISRIRILCGI